MDEHANQIADENTRRIVASNLTIVYCATRPEIADEEKIIEVYGRFLKLLTPEKKDRYDPNESQSSSFQSY